MPDVRLPRALPAAPRLRKGAGAAARRPETRASARAGAFFLFFAGAFSGAFLPILEAGGEEEEAPARERARRRARAMFALRAARARSLTQPRALTHAHTHTHTHARTRQAKSANDVAAAAAADCQKAIQCEWDTVSQWNTPEVRRRGSRRLDGFYCFYFVFILREWDAVTRWNTPEVRRRGGRRDPFFFFFFCEWGAATRFVLRERGSGIRVFRERSKSGQKVLSLRVVGEAPAMDGRREGGGGREAERGRRREGGGWREASWATGGWGVGREGGGGGLGQGPRRLLRLHRRRWEGEGERRAAAGGRRERREWRGAAGGREKEGDGGGGGGVCCNKSLFYFMHRRCVSRTA